MKVNYYVNDKKGVVVCKISGIRKSFREELEKKDMRLDVLEIISIMRANPIPDTQIGKAKCSGGDMFDENIGKKLAYKRAIANVNSVKKQAIRYALGDIDKKYKIVSRGMNELIAKHQKAVDFAKKDVNLMIEDINK